MFGTLRNASKENNDDRNLPSSCIASKKATKERSIPHRNFGSNVVSSFVQDESIINNRFWEGKSIDQSYIKR